MSASSAFTIIYLCATIFHTEQAPLYFFALEQGVSLTYPMSHQYVKERGRQTEREREREREREKERGWCLERETWHQTWSRGNRGASHMK